jgi:hypothetical protein
MADMASLPPTPGRRPVVLPSLALLASLVVLAGGTIGGARGVLARLAR